MIAAMIKSWPNSGQDGGPAQRDLGYPGHRGHGGGDRKRGAPRDAVAAQAEAFVAQTSSVPSERSAMLFSAAAASWVTPVSPGTFAGVRTVGPAVIPRRRQYGAPGKSGID